MKGAMGFALALLFAASGAQAEDSRQAARDSIEASMLVTGSIDVDEQGLVERFAIDDQEKIPSVVRQLLEQQVPKWRFEPTLVGDRAAAVHTTMRIRVAANKVPGEEDRFALGITGASFGGEAPGESVSRVELEPPVFPYQLHLRGVTGTAFILCKVGRDGSVEDVIAEQVNLRGISNERMMQQAREMFANAAMKAARRWRFQPPTAGPDVDAPFWSVRVPVDFLLEDQESPGYGEWTSYVPGPRQVAPWEIVDTAVGADTFASGDIYQVGPGSLKLVTPLMSSS